MIKFVNSLLLLGALSIPTTKSFNYRPYISTNLAKTTMTYGIDNEIIEEKCDGSGWITHGDGHRTECTGCSACKSSKQTKTTAEDCGSRRLGPIRRLLFFWR